MPSYPTNRSRKIKIEFTDKQGAKYSLSTEGTSRDTLLKLLDFIDSVSPNTSTYDDLPVDSNFAKLYQLIEANFRLGSFSSTDVLQAYQEQFNAPSNLSTISTYLARLADRGLLIRTKHGSSWLYKLSKGQPQQSPDNSQLNHGVIPP